MTGQRFGRLVVIERIKGTDSTVWWSCRGDCGKLAKVRGISLRATKPRRTTRSCGCLGREVAIALLRSYRTPKQHGKVGTPVYAVWASMIQRCTNPKNKDWGLYGGRGITVCNEWLDFANFYRDMGDQPPGLTLDRKNNDGNYEIGNCRWTSQAVQRGNRRPPRLKPTCKHGHPFTEENTHLDKKGKRCCKTCRLWFLRFYAVGKAILRGRIKR